MYNKNKRGPSTVPWVMPVMTEAPRVSDTYSPADWLPADKPTELSRIKLKNLNSTARPYDQQHSAHSTSLPVGFCTWLWGCTCLLLLISMLRQAIFESKWDKVVFWFPCFLSLVVQSLFLLYHSSDPWGDPGKMLSGTGHFLWDVLVDGWLEFKYWPAFFNGEGW